jgi:hypothetical protein
VFFSGTGEDVAIIEELAGLCFMKGRTISKENSNEVMKCVTEKLGLTLACLEAVCSDGTPSARGKNLSSVTLVGKCLYEDTKTPLCYPTVSTM